MAKLSIESQAFEDKILPLSVGRAAELQRIVNYILIIVFNRTLGPRAKFVKIT